MIRHFAIKDDIYKLVLSQRRLLLEREAKTIARLDRLYKKSIPVINARIKEFESKLKRAQEERSNVSRYWLFEVARLEELLKTIQGQIDTFAEAAYIETVGSAEASAFAALSDSKEQLSTVLEGSFVVLPTQQLEEVLSVTGPGTPLERLLRGFGEETAKKAEETLFQGIALGQGPKKIARSLKQILDVPLYRAERISRTESIRAYRGTVLRSYQANSDVLRGWRWTSSKSSRTCPMCLAQDGKVFTLDQPMYSHVSCRCVKAPVLIGEAEEVRQTGSQWFLIQPEAVQLKILGPEKQRLIAQGKITLEDLVDSGYDPEWGPWRSEKSIKKLILEGKLSKRDLLSA